MSPVETDPSSPASEVKPVSPAASPESTKAPSLPKIVEALTKMSAAFAVFGYLSLRSHLNTLGISSSGTFGVERYLAELPEIVGIIFFPLLALGIPLAILGVLGATGSFLGRRIPAHWPLKTRLARIRNFVFAFVESVEGPVLISAGILLLGWYTLQAQTSKGSTSIGLAVGDLTTSRRPEGWTAFFVILYGCGIAYLLCHACRRHVEERQGKHANLWYVPMALIGCVALQLPILYGRILHNSEYVKAQISLAPEPGSAHAEPLCGLILLRENSDILLWQVRDTVGVIRALPISEIKQSVTGESADIWELIERAAHHEQVSLCPVGVSR
jgi:hypothetical protein